MVPRLFTKDAIDTSCLSISRVEEIYKYPRIKIFRSNVFVFDTLEVYAERNCSKIGQHIVDGENVLLFSIIYATLC